MLEPIAFAGGDVFSVVQSNPALPTGLAAVHINYPFQAATLQQLPPERESQQSVQHVGSGQQPLERQRGQRSRSPTGNAPWPQHDGNIGTPGWAPATGADTYGGLFGLGSQEALGLSIRPFRRVLSAQAIFRREVFGNDM